MSQVRRQRKPHTSSPQGAPVDELGDMTFATNDSFIDLHSPSSPDPFTLSFNPSSTLGLAESLASVDSTQPLRRKAEGSHRNSSGGGHRRRAKQDIRIVTDSAVTRAPKTVPQSVAKPTYRRSASIGPSKGALRPDNDDIAVRGGPPSAPPEPVPPTTNYLNARERADLIRKSRKLTQLFGVTPSESLVNSSPALPPPPRVRHTRGTRSIAVGLDSPSERRSAETGTARSGSNRRFSAPLSPHDTASLSSMLTETGAEDEDEAGRPPRTRRRSRRKEKAVDRMSFIDLSEEEDENEHDHGQPHSRSSAGFSKRPRSPSGLSLLSLSTVDLAKEERRKQRDRLAKLNRFLGSGIPSDLVLGYSDPSDDPLPERAPTPPGFETPAAAIDPKAWKRLRRRSSSAAEMKTRWFDDGERVKAELDDREKAINVRRAVKMEKLFGVPPPQTLYHTRNCSPITPAHISDHDRTPPSSPSMRNINQSAYINKGKAIKTRRLSDRSMVSESMQNLLSDEGDTADSPSSEFDPSRLRRRTSSVYMQYRYSLNSLKDIIDRDDKESIAEIHQYLTRNASELAPVSDDDEQRLTPTAASLLSNNAPSTSLSSDIKGLRRRSLPTRSSSLSLASQYTLAEPAMQSFQTRRRRAAKLTSFFGVDYRVLIGEILESIERDVQVESSRGDLAPDEVQDLLQKLRKLKTKRTTFVQ